MRQKAYNSVAALMNAGTQLSAGANSLATALGLVVGTKPLIDADLNALTIGKNAYAAGKGDLRDRRTELEQAAAAAYHTVVTIRDSLKRTLGQSYSPAWDGTGFNYSLKVKKSVAGLENHLSTLQEYLTDHAHLELANVATAVLAGETLEALTAANTAVTLQKAVVRGLLNARRLKEKGMRKRIRGVVEELSRVLGDLDTRWETFGLNQPGLKETPPTPTNLAVAMAGNNAVFKWDKTARAEYYRIWVKIAGSNDEAQPVGTPADNDFTIENPAANTQFEVSVSASNNGGESPRSAAVFFQTA